MGWFQLQRHLRELQEALRADDTQAIRTKVQEIVPEYSYQPAVEPAGAQRKQIRLIVQERLQLDSIPVDGD